MSMKNIDPRHYYIFAVRANGDLFTDDYKDIHFHIDCFYEVRSRKYFHFSEWSKICNLAKLTKDKSVYQVLIERNKLDIDPVELEKIFNADLSALHGIEWRARFNNCRVGLIKCETEMGAELLEQYITGLSKEEFREFIETSKF